MTAQEIVKLLAAKHSEDVFVTECKDGPTGEGLRRLDAWAMRRSWSKPTTFGYEVKVSRGDFLRDEKWRDYLPLCSAFYFVCPCGLIDPKELPSEAGLLWVAKTGGRLWDKKRAPLRKTSGDDLEPVFRYILMARSRIGPEISKAASVEEWRRFAEQRREERSLGHCNSKRVHQTLRDRVYKVEAENKRLAAENEGLEEVRKTLKELGIDSSWRPAERIRQQYANLAREFPPNLQWDFEGAARTMQKIADILKKANE
jgi:hypothetical protein